MEIPTSYISHIECEVNAKSVDIRSLECDNIELDIKTSRITLEDISGKVKN